MNKKSHKKKKQQHRRVRTPDARNKENYEEIVPDTNETTHDDEVAMGVSYNVERNDVMGRYLVANRPIAAGEEILSAPALVVGPTAGCPIVCLGCYLLLPARDIYRCPGCSWPICGPTCAGLGHSLGHSEAECRVLVTIPPQYEDLQKLTDQYYFITPLRCLLLKSTAPAAWTAVVAMESHDQLRRQRDDIWPNNQTRVVDVLRGVEGAGAGEGEIHTVCGILEVNAFEVGGYSNSARALFDRAYLLSHSCVPTTSHADSCQPTRTNSHEDSCRSTRTLSVRAAVSHRSGDLLTLSYAYTLQGTLRRRAHLQHSKFFWCVCARCSDKTELGTYASALICPHCGTNESQKLDNQQKSKHSIQKSTDSNPNSTNSTHKSTDSAHKSNGSRQPCTKLNDTTRNCSESKLNTENANGKSNGSCQKSKDSTLKSDYSSHKSNDSSSCDDKLNVPPSVLPVDPLDMESEWKCSHCRYTLKADAVDLLLKRLTDDLDSIDANDVKGFEQFLYKYRNVLHYNHYLNLSAKHSLSQLYGKVTEYMIGDMSERELLRKVEICRDLIAVFDVIEPGLSRLRGITLYELHAPLMVLTTRDFERKTITKENLRIRLKEVVHCLKEAVKILAMEPPDSSEGLMATAAAEALSKIYTWEQIIGKI